jgi:4-oxalocrotonate tautomerase
LRWTSGETLQEGKVPFIRITVLGPPLGSEQVAQLQNETTNLMESALGKVASLTSVLVEQPSVANWTIGRNRASVAVHVNATITAGTNSATEKARYIELTMNLLRSTFGTELSSATYIVLEEVPAQSWGYDGRTQESRRQPPA